MSFNKKLIAAIEQPKGVGIFSHEEARSKGMRLSIAQEDQLMQGWAFALFLLVDESDGVIADAKYQLFGPPVWIAILEAITTLLLRKTYDQATRLKADLVDREMRVKSEERAFSEEAFSYIEQVLSALQKSLENCRDIALSNYTAPPLSHEAQGEQQEYPGWRELSLPKKLEVIEEVIDREIRPYIELDEGGVKILDLINGHQLLIAYEGSCTSCYAATGSTLSAIQDILRAKVDRTIEVVPQF